MDDVTPLIPCLRNEATTDDLPSQDSRYRDAEH